MREVGIARNATKGRSESDSKEQGGGVDGQGDRGIKCGACDVESVSHEHLVQGSENT